MRETFGALVAMAQAERSSDPTIRKAMQRIAEDETRHAELSWAIAAWIAPRLDIDQRKRVHDAMNAAIDDLEAETHTMMHPDLIEVAGLPPPAMASRMVAELRETLWSDAA